MDKENITITAAVTQGYAVKMSFSDYAAFALLRYLQGVEQDPVEIDFVAEFAVQLETSLDKIYA